MVDISVIMPVFNDESYLEEAVESVVNQSLKNIELICIDDGSSDGSLNILNELKNKYDNIIVVSQENQGVAATRNNAMDIAKGQYLAFIDSDDIFMENDALERLFEVAKKNNANMVSGNLTIWNGKKKFVPITFLKYYEEEEVILPENYGVPFSFTKAIFKREFLEDNKIRFPLLTKGEDPVFLAEILSKLDYVYAVPVDVYAYRYIDGSVKYNSYQNYYDQVMHYKLVFDYMSDPKFDKNTHLFKYQLIGLFDFMPEEQAKPTLKAIREVFADDPKILRQCEEYFYFKYNDNKELSHLVELKKDPNKPLISVIVPIYNDENYLNSIKNILKQSLEDIEVICINDGSTDESMAILNEIDDERIRIINQENEGYANSKNKGLKESRGEFIYFHEPGNILLKDYLEKLYRNAITNDSDIVFSKFNNSDRHLLDCNYGAYDFSKGIKGINLNKYTFDFHEFKSCVLNSPFSLCNKLFRKEFLDKNEELIFESDLAFEDVLFHIKSMLKAYRISFARNTKYKNNYNNPKKYYNSLISQDIFKVIFAVENFLKRNNCYDELLNEFKRFKFTNIINHMAFVRDEDYFQLSKRELYNIGFKEYKNIDSKILERYIDIIKSDSLEDFKSYEDKKHEKEMKSNYKSLQKTNNKLLKKNKKLKKQVKKSKKLNKQMSSSKSWNVTSSVRNLKDSLKKD